MNSSKFCGMYIFPFKVAEQLKLKGKESSFTKSGKFMKEPLLNKNIVDKIRDIDDFVRCFIATH